MRYMFLSVLIFLAPTLSQAAEVSQGTMLSLSCFACHGTDGASPGAIPSIKGRPASYLIDALTEYREGKRSSTVMGRHAKGYSDKEIKLIAEYFASIK